jgi:hypothetical protein
MHGKEVQYCERTGRFVGHCGCGDCYARRLASLVRNDRTLRTVPASPPRHPRYLVTHSL